VLAYLGTAGDYKVKAQCGTSEDTITVTAIPTNPMNQKVVIYYDKAGYSGSSFWADCGDVCYDPDCCGWCGHYTSQTNKFKHAHTPDGFPAYHDLDGDGDNETITRSDSDAFWNEHYDTATLISSATCSSNCYGYTTARGYWINTGGWDVVMEDDYTSGSGTDAEFYTHGNPGNHAVEIYSYYGSGYIYKTRQKDQTSGVYEKTYDDGEFEPGSHPGTYYWWKSK